MESTLVILAAGMASRYGSMKQIQSFGLSGETIMDYSIYDAIKAGFTRVVFIIRREFADNFKAIFEPKLKGRIATAYVYQEMDAWINGFSVPEDRTKPWGTGHAVLCARDAVDSPFAVINADDFYGQDAFQKAAAFLRTEAEPGLLSIIGYELAKTLSENGSVSRGVCQVNAEGYLDSITEMTKIYRQNGRIIAEEADAKNELAEDSRVSMNFWCFHPSVFTLAESMFHQFLKENIGNLKSEFYIPLLGDQFIKLGHGRVKVIPTSSSWFGVTYKEDAPGVEASIRQLIAGGVYPEALWG